VTAKKKPDELRVRALRHLDLLNEGEEATVPNDEFWQGRINAGYVKVVTDDSAEDASPAGAEPGGTGSDR